VAKGIDFAFYPHPSTAAIKAEGATFVCRYVSAYAPSDTQGKNLLAAEKDALLAAGISIVIVAEEDAGRMLGGGPAGVADAAHADAVVKALGMKGMPIYFACDFDATEAQQTPIHAYLDGAASVIGRPRVGIYGGYYPVKRACDAGKVTWAWQTYAWSGGQWDPRVQLRQVENGVRIGGADCDRDLSMAADYGQWPRPGAQPTPPVPGQLPAPAWLAADRARIPLCWAPVPGSTVTGYTCVAYGIDGKEYARVVTGATQTWCVLGGLAPGGTYTIRCWANGGSVAPAGASLTITLPT
jgi:Rv2525c-like, glycoside hydrolase-like domain